MLGEVRAALEPLRLLARFPRLRRLPRGGHRPVVDIPGWLAPEAALAPLRQYLRWLGYDAQGWGLGVNRADPEASAIRLAPKIRRLAEAAGEPIHLVGWSLGGVVARETARRLPEAVASVVSFGSPIIGGPVYTAASRRFDEAAKAQILARIQAARKTPIQQPVTVIYSRRDAVVDWLACLDHHEPRAHHVEVRSSHFGLGMDPDVWEAVAQSLADAAPPPPTST